MHNYYCVSISVLNIVVYNIPQLPERPEFCHHLEHLDAGRTIQASEVEAVRFVYVVGFSCDQFKIVVVAHGFSRARAGRLLLPPTMSSGSSASRLSISLPMIAQASSRPLPMVAHSRYLDTNSLNRRSLSFWSAWAAGGGEQRLGVSRANAPASIFCATRQNLSGPSSSLPILANTSTTTGSKMLSAFEEV